jgi:hypothetical protein
VARAWERDSASIQFRSQVLAGKPAPLADDTVDFYRGLRPRPRCTKQGFLIARVAYLVRPSPTVRREQTHFSGRDHDKTPRNKGGSATVSQPPAPRSVPQPVVN